MIPAAKPKLKGYHGFMMQRRSRSGVAPLGVTWRLRHSQVVFSRPAQVGLTLLALVLLLPLAGLPFHDSDILERFHNRMLSNWTSGKLLRHDPAPGRVDP